MMRCPNCGFEVPPGAYCVRCGSRLEGETVDHAHHPHGWRGFAAAPHEHAHVPRIISTLFPHLPRAGMDTFRVLLALGTALIGALALAGLFPVALIAAAVVVPLLVVLYLREVNVYEDEPLRVLGLTAVWGALVGVGVGFLADAVRSRDATLASPTTGREVLWHGVLIPLIGFAAVLVGPVALLRYRKFNELLDGVTFGGAAAVVFAGAELLTHSSTFLAAGLEPAGLVTPWTVRLLTLGIAVPVLAAAAVGSAAGALWLRFRAPRRDRERLGLLGHPIVALPLAAVLLVASALVQLYLGRWAALAAVAGLAVFALAWLRQLIHLGLLEEAAETEIGRPLTCPNCGRETPRHTFCAHCGVSLRALPKSGRPHHRRARVHALARFGVALAVLVGIAVAVMAAVEPGSAGSPCPVHQACANPPRAAATEPPSQGAPANETTWKSSLGVQLTYDASRWHVHAVSDRRLDLTNANHLLELLVETRNARDTSQEQLLANKVGFLRGRYPDLDLDSSHQPASAAIGSVDGLGEAFAGHDRDGRPVEALIEVASAAGVSVAVTTWVSQQAHTSRNGEATPFDVLVNADALLETFRWPFERELPVARSRNDG